MIIQTAVREQINKIQVGLRSPESLDRPTPSSFIVPCTALERCLLWDWRELVSSTCKGEQLHPKLSHYRFRNFANMLSLSHFNPRFEMLITSVIAVYYSILQDTCCHMYIFTSWVYAGLLFYV